MQTITPTARVRVTLRFTTVYYGQATFELSILIIFYNSTKCAIQVLDVAFNL